MPVAWLKVNEQVLSLSNCVLHAQLPWDVVAVSICRPRTHRGLQSQTHALCDRVLP